MITSMRSARQRARIRRLTVIGALGTSLVAAGVIAGGVVFGSGPSTPMVPAASPGLPSESAPSQDPDQTQDPDQPNPDLLVNAELKKIIKENLPERMTMGKYRSYGVWGGSWLSFELGDAKGHGWGGVSLDRVSWTADEQTRTPSSTVTCDTKTVAGGEILIKRNRTDPGDSNSYSFVRPNSTRVWFSQ